MNKTFQLHCLYKKKMYNSKYLRHGEDMDKLEFPVSFLNTDQHAQHTVNSNSIPYTVKPNKLR